MENENIEQGLEDQARQWYLRLQEDPGNDELRESFLEWYEADERHRDVYTEVAAFWLEIDEMAEAEELPEELLSDDESQAAVDTVNPVLDSRIVNVTYLGSRQRKHADTGTRQFPGRRIARVAAAVVVLVAVSVAYYGYSRYLPEGTYRTGVGEQAQLELADGSRVFMNTDTVLREEYTDNLRKVVLVNGEAIFDVKQDPVRPFLVETDFGSTRAVGTSFSVYDRDDKIEVIVIEGTVALHRNSDLQEVLKTSEDEESKPLYVKGGQKIYVYDDHFGTVGQASALDLDRLIFWREGKVVFRGQPLSEIVREMARYTNRKIIITDRSIKQMKMGGAFDIDDFDAFINAVEDAFPVKVIRVTPYVTFIIEA
ncbi:FecR family protein [Emcibacter sp.]|uniref:FecR family protein n=1 Tax=Emcibacter sp. TaxID=1979954 RepID=UPI003A8E39C5